MGPVELVTSELRQVSPSKFVFRLIHDRGVLDDLQVRDGSLVSARSTEREALVLSRLGQGTFRRDLIAVWNGRCAVTAMAFPEVFRASHIKPWTDSDNAERFDPYNGLLLSPQYDSLFDRGYVTFENGGRMVLSPAIQNLDATRLGIDPNDHLRFVDPRHQPYLDYHRGMVFKHRAS